jgi:hypothetical protein
MDQAVYPREHPWRVLWSVLSGGPLATRAGRLSLLGMLLLLGVIASGLPLRGPVPAQLLSAALLSLSGFSLLWLVLRYASLRATFLTQPGVDLPADLAPHPLIRPLLLTAVAAAGLFSGVLILNLADPALARDALGGLLLGSSIALSLGRFFVRRMGLRVAGGALVSHRGTTPVVMPLDKIERVVWRAGRTGGEPDQLELAGEGGRVKLRGWHERSDDHIRNLLRLILQPRLDVARARFRREGHLACGPLRIYPDYFSRPEDTPPLRLPFALARSAHIDHEGRLAVEIEGRHDPLVLLTPEEFPVTPLALRLISELWTVPAPQDENHAAENAPAEGGEDAELVN